MSPLPWVRAEAKVNDYLIDSYETLIAEKEFELYNMIEARNAAANAYNELVFGLFGSLYSVQGLEIDGSIMPKSGFGEKGTINFNFKYLDGTETSISFNNPECVDQLDFEIGLIEELENEPPIPNVPGPINNGNRKIKKSSSNKSSSSNKVKISRKSAASIKSGVDSNYRGTVHYTQSKAVARVIRMGGISKQGNTWNNFLEATKGLYSGENWILQAAQDYLFLKSKGLLC